MSDIPVLRADCESYPELDDKQLGHLRHVENLAWQSDGDWDHMGSLKAMQEWVDSYRYQLAQMAYAVGFAHFHHVPAAPAAFQPLFERLIHKLLLPEVWVYWRETSRSGVRVDPDIEELREGWTDPVAHENIMYSGRLYAVLGMHSMLFDSDRYNEPGAIAFRWEPIFYGLGPEVYEYTFDSLTDVLYWQMVESGYLGIVCEPNCLFLVCNQFAILGFRFHDLRTGGSMAEEVTSAFVDAWEKQKGGFLDEYGDYWRFWLLRQERPVYSLQGATSAWVGLNMNSWNREFVAEHYPAQIADEIEVLDDGTVTLVAPTVAHERRLARFEERAPRFDVDTDFVWGYPAFGYTAAWMSEVGDAEKLEGMLRHADKYMNPTWERGGLFYPRNDRSWDAAGNMTYMDRLSGNAMVAYARLNVKDGLWSMYNEPWGEDHFREPCLVDLADQVRVRRGWYDEATRVLVVTAEPERAPSTRARFEFANIAPESTWDLFVDGEFAASGAPGHVDRRALEDSVVVEMVGDRLTVEMVLPQRSTLAVQLD